MRVVENVTELIGGTPMLKYPVAGLGGPLYMKLERANPAGSNKDRIALNMIDEAERTGQLKPGGTIVESSSGNTATALAMIAAARGYKFIAVVDDHCAREKVDAVKAFGGTVVRIQSSRSGLPSPNEREERAARIAQETPDAFWTNQAENPANASAYDTLAAEILEQVPDVEVLIGAVGTGGSISGTSRAMRAAGKRIRVVGVEPIGSTYFSISGANYLQSGTGNPPGASVPGNFDPRQVDEGMQVSDAAAFTTCRFLATRLGLLVGPSSGGLVFMALEYVTQNIGRKTVVLVPDAGEKYVNTAFNEAWLQEHHLIDKHLWSILEDATAQTSLVS